MRRLILLRHAKSDRPPGVSDLDRPLNARGQRDAPRMGAYLAAEDLRADAVVVSPALRTRQTWEGVQPALNGPQPEIVSSIYEAPETALLAVARGAPKAAASLLMIGHNPGLQDLALYLVGAGDKSGRKRLGYEFPTAAIAVIDFEADSWDGLKAGSGRLERFVAPKDLEAVEDLETE